MDEYEYNAVGDYRRRNQTELESEASIYWGGAGSHQSKWYEKRNPVTGAWEPTNPGENYEAETYFWAGVTSQPYYEAYAHQQSGTSTALDKARVSDPASVGQALSRPDLVALNPLGLRGAEAAFYSASTLDDYQLTAQEQEAANQQISQSTPAAQAARSGGGMGAMGIVGLIALAVAAIYTGGAAAGLWGAAEGAAAGAAEAAASSSWLDALPALGDAPAAGAWGAAETSAAVGGSAAASTSWLDTLPPLGDAPAASNMSPSLWDTVKGAYTATQPVRNAYSAASMLNTLTGAGGTAAAGRSIASAYANQGQPSAYLYGGSPAMREATASGNDLGIVQPTNTSTNGLIMLALAAGLIYMVKNGRS